MCLYMSKKTRLADKHSDDYVRNKHNTNDVFINHYTVSIKISSGNCCKHVRTYKYTQRLTPQLVEYSELIRRLYKGLNQL